MNKTLHRFRFFVLDKLSELQRTSTHDLSLIASLQFMLRSNGWFLFPLLLSSMFFTQGASATDFYWFTTLYDRAPHSSPAAACADVIYKIPCDKTSAGSTGYCSFVKASYVTDTKFACYWIYDYGSVVKESNGNVFAYRGGSTCPVGTTYNPTNGECTNDEQKGPPGSCPTGFVNNPINTANGNKYQAEVDYPNSGASTLSFTRTYNSLDGLWRHNHSTYLRIAGSPVFKVSLVMSHGRESFFTVSGTTVTASPTELGVLVKTAEGWLYTAENNERFTFDTAGRLVQWANTTGASHQLTYANGTVTVTDNLGHSLSFSEDAQHQPLSLSVDGLQITYTYNTNQRLTQLTRSRNGQSEQRQFHYEDPRNTALLTGITDERGVRFATWSYDEKGRAISSEHAGGVERGTVMYNADGSSTVTNELGKSTVYRFVSIGGIKRVSAVEGEASANCPNSNSTFTYDERGLLKTKTDNKGHLTTYNYNARGLEESRTEASGTPQARTITTEWHPTLNLPVTVTEPSRITTHSYDAQGRKLSQTVTNR